MPERHASSAESTERRVSVLLPLPLAGVYDYSVPQELNVTLGDFVAVPLGKRQLLGVVWGEGTGEVASTRLKAIDESLAAPPLPDELRRFVDWVANYTLSPPGAVLRMAMSVPDALEPARPLAGFVLTEAGRAALAASDATLTKPRRRVLDAAADGGAATASDLAERAACSAGVVRALAALGLLRAVDLPRRVVPVAPDFRCAGPVLSDAQRDAARALEALVQQDAFSVTLLDGVTGSGKTEVYFDAIAACLARGKQALVLLPEIALSAQFLARFAVRFGAPPALWHSELRHAQRRDTWREVADGKAPVVVGARSALFLPFPDLGLIVIDEEQDGSYKQEDGVIYHARDMAVVRGSLAKRPVILVSATPSLETLVNVEQGRYRRLHLPSRFGDAKLPEIRVVDMRRNPPERQRFLSPPLVKALAETLEAGEQAMLFLNRRGYAPLTLCRSCGHRLECPNCTAWLVEHRLLGQLQCHHCGHAEPLPALCPNCGEAKSFVPCGPGIERLSEEVALRFPDARLGVMASDTLTGPHAAEEIIRAVEAHEIDVLIGTQVVAKGHHFPLLTLVGVVDADLGLEGGDLRAAERTFQLLHQVSGRAGRAERPGIVYIQTWMPDHGVMAALLADDRDRFFALEADSRKAHGMPPFGRLAAVIVSAPDDESADFTARALARAAPHLPGVETLGPAPAPLRLLRGRHRRRFLVKARREVNLQAVVRQWLARVKVPGNVRLQVDIDPYSFL
ncbi:MAG TPA: primosomal protein N' [Stellaceae bacterium]|jgi:primosomal protein N' (replication factor Y)|nr:primosomal protein N' [Stellaceae bacterium]